MYEEYTDKQIVEMLKPKLEKLCPYYDWNGYLNNEGYEIWLHFVATLYKSGYIRGQLGRSFIIGEKKTKEPVSTFKVGDKVKFLGLSIDDEEALNNRRFYPPVNTVGKVEGLGSDYCFIQWPDGITSGDGLWACRYKYLKKVTERWVPVNGNNIKKGSFVRYIDEQRCENFPEFYPVKDTVGKVIKVSSDRGCKVQWPNGSTSGMDKWWAAWCNLEVLVCE